MAEVVTHWIRDDVAPTLDALGMSLRGVETLESFGCRSFNGISGAHLSEHGHANALDVRSLKLANGTVIELTNATVSKTATRTVATDGVYSLFDGTRQRGRRVSREPRPYRSDAAN